MKTYDGCASGDVKKFFFFFENVVMRGKTDEENSVELLSNCWTERPSASTTPSLARINASASSYAVLKNSIIEGLDQPDDLRKSFGCR